MKLKKGDFIIDEEGKVGLVLDVGDDIIAICRPGFLSTKYTPHLIDFYQDFSGFDMFIKITEQAVTEKLKELFLEAADECQICTLDYKLHDVLRKADNNDSKR